MNKGFLMRCIKQGLALQANRAFPSALKGKAPSAEDGWRPWQQV